MSEQRSSVELTPRHALYALVGAALLLVMGVLVIASGLVAPPWAVGVLVALWLVGLVDSLRRWRTGMYVPLLWGVGIGLAWVALISLGGAVLGWTA